MSASPAESSTIIRSFRMRNWISIGPTLSNPNLRKMMMTQNLRTMTIPTRFTPSKPNLEAKRKGTALR